MNGYKVKVVYNHEPTSKGVWQTAHCRKSCKSGSSSGPEESTPSRGAIEIIALD